MKQIQKRDVAVLVDIEVVLGDAILLGPAVQKICVTL